MDRLICLTLALALVWAPVVQAVEPEQAVGVKVAGLDVVEDGALVAAAFDLIDGDGRLESLTWVAEKTTGSMWSREKLSLPGGLAAEPFDPSQSDLPYDASQTVTGGTLLGHADFRLHILPVDDGAHVVAGSTALEHRALSDACINEYGIEGRNQVLGEVPAGDIRACKDYDPHRTTENQVAIGANRVVTYAESARILVAGDFVLEVEEIAFEVDTGEVWDSRETQAGASDFKHFMRIEITDGLLELEYSGTFVESEWVLEKPHILADQATLGINGRTDSGDFDLTLLPSGDYVRVEPAGAAPASPAAPGATGAWIALWSVVAAASVAVATFFAARHLRRPSMNSVEKALEAGEFGRAANLSSRILRRDPHRESAHLSRAIAWARGGEPHRVVAELGGLLSSYSPRDGTLHYVLGLAHLDLGDRAAARQAMEKAVQLTPALLDELSPDLRPAGRVDGPAYS